MFLFINKNNMHILSKTLKKMRFKHNHVSYFWGEVLTF